MQDDYGDLLMTPQEIERRFAEGDERFVSLEAELRKNTAVTEGVQRDVALLVDLLNAMRGAFRVLNWIGKLAKPLGYIVMLATAVAGFWAAIKGGTHR